MIILIISSRVIKIIIRLLILATLKLIVPQDIYHLLLIIAEHWRIHFLPTRTLLLYPIVPHIWIFLDLSLL